MKLKKMIVAVRVNNKIFSEPSETDQAFDLRILRHLLSLRLLQQNDVLWKSVKP